VKPTVENHPDWAELQRLFPAIRAYQELATRHGIDDIFQDNGGKLLQTLLILNLARGPGREGADAVDQAGNEYELKSLNVRLVRSFTTHHHLNRRILSKYRSVHAWYFSVYDHIELLRIYRLETSALEPLFSKWESKLRLTKKDINNPKIPMKFVETNGVLIYPSQGSPPKLPVKE
jgi:hypothetical protein